VKLFEEIKIMFQDLPSRIERSDITRSKRRRRFPPGMVEELMFGTKNPILGVRVGLSLLRDVLPWVYEEGCALLNKLQTAKTPTAKRKLVQEFEELLMVSSHNPYIEKYMVQSEDDYLLFRELPRMIMHSLNRVAGEA
jgi:hypothetical protein